MKKDSLWFLSTIFILLFSAKITNGQKLKQLEIEDGTFIKKFTIDKNTKLKEGEYLKIHSRTNDTICKGRYKNGNRIGDWIFTYNDLNFKYNYENSDFLFLDTLFKNNNDFYVKKGEIYSLDKVDRPPIYLDSELDLRDFLARTIVLSEDIKWNTIEDYSVASIVVDTLGDYRFLRIEKSISESFDKKIIETIQSIPNTFLPAIKDNKAIESKIFIVFNVAHEKPKLNIKPAHFRLVIYVNYYSVPLITPPNPR